MNTLKKMAAIFSVFAFFILSNTVANAKDDSLADAFKGAKLNNAFKIPTKVAQIASNDIVKQIQQALLKEEEQKFAHCGSCRRRTVYRTSYRTRTRWVPRTRTRTVWVRRRIRRTVYVPVRYRRRVRVVYRRRPVVYRTRVIYRRPVVYRRTRTYYRPCPIW